MDEGSSTRRVKVHCIRNSDSHDEWTKQDIISLDDDPDPNLEAQEVGNLTKHFSLHESKSKASLNSGRKESPIVKIDMAFDRIEFNGGLHMRECRNNLFNMFSSSYMISRYQDLN